MLQTRAKTKILKDYSIIGWKIVDRNKEKNIFFFNYALVLLKDGVI